MQEGKKRTIIYLDDEEINLLLFKEMFKNDFDIHTTTSPQKALDFIKNNGVEIVLTDQLMPIMTGVEFLEKLKNSDVDVMPKRVMISGYSQEGEVSKALEDKLLDEFVSKPWTYDGLKDVLLTI